MPEFGVFNIFEHEVDSGHDSPGITSLELLIEELTDAAVLLLSEAELLCILPRTLVLNEGQPFLQRGAAFVRV